jgi:hypothetical protein
MFGSPGVGRVLERGRLIVELIMDTYLANELYQIRTFSDTISPVLRPSWLSGEERSGMALEVDPFDAHIGQAKHRLLVSLVLKLMA